MDKSEVTEEEAKKQLGGQKSMYLFRVPRKNHETMLRLVKPFDDLYTKHGGSQWIAQLSNNTNTIEGLTNLAYAVSAGPDEEVWLILGSFTNSKHKEEFDAKMNNDESAAKLFEQLKDIIVPGSYYAGEFISPPT
jgi:hypothetical protein